MKHDELRSIAHNIADSLASGIGLLIGVYDTDIFREAKESQEGYITVDFLRGTAEGAVPSKSLAKAIKLYSEALPDLCERHGGSILFFQSLTARYECDALNRHVTITIEDKNGRRSTNEYVGVPLSKMKTIDGLGRVRTKRK
jgi:hypothetical protein